MNGQAAQTLDPEATLATCWKKWSGDAKFQLVGCDVDVDTNDLRLEIEYTVRVGRPNDLCRRIGAFYSVNR